MARSKRQTSMNSLRAEIQMPVLQFPIRSTKLRRYRSPADIYPFFFPPLAFADR
jgi:hypothetical protein